MKMSDYNHLLAAANEGHNVLSAHLVSNYFISSSLLIGETNRELYNQLSALKNAYVLLRENPGGLRKSSLRPQIAELTAVTGSLYAIHGQLETLLTACYSEGLCEMVQLVAARIDVMHDILRLLKKHSPKQPLPATSGEALTAVLISRRTRIQLSYEC